MKDTMLNTIRKIRDNDYQITKALTSSQIIEYYHRKAAGFDELVKTVSRPQKKQANRP